MEWVLYSLLIIFGIIAIRYTNISETQIYEYTKLGCLINVYDYNKADPLLTPPERSFLLVLNQTVGDNTLVFSQVRVVDVITPKKHISPRDWQKSFSKISGKHFDFILCNKNDFSIICAIELNDGSQYSENRKSRYKFLVEACTSANLPLIRLITRKIYNSDELESALARAKTAGHTIYTGK